MPRPWNDWYHCIGHTYGSWLPGDPRGWRSRHHREHVEGDYRNPPPPGRDERVLERAQRLMTRGMIVLDAGQRQIAFDAFKEAFAIHHLPLAALAVSTTHAHVLARFEPGRQTRTGRLIADPARHFFGIARKQAARRLSDLGVGAGGVKPGGVWSKRSKVVPITQRGHFESTRRYIVAHHREGAVVWGADLGDFNVL